MLRMHSNRKVVHKINRINVTYEETNEDSSNQFLDGGEEQWMLWMDIIFSMVSVSIHQKSKKY